MVHSMSNNLSLFQNGRLQMEEKQDHFDVNIILRLHLLELIQNYLGFVFSFLRCSYEKLEIRPSLFGAQFSAEIEIT